MQTAVVFVIIDLQDSRAEILSNLNKCKELQAELSAELDKYRECDPEVMQRMKDETVVAKEAANRWTGKLGRSIQATAKMNFRLKLIIGKICHYYTCCS